MKKITFLALLAFSSIFLFTDCKRFKRAKEHLSGVQKTITLDLKDFEGVDFGRASVMTVTASDTFSVVITGDSVSLSALDATVKSKTLNIGFRTQNLWDNMRGGLQIEVKMPRLNSASLSGASRLEIGEGVKSDNFKASLSGSSVIVATKLDTKELKCDLSGASLIEWKGTAESIDAELSGASTIDAENGSVKTANLDLSGASSVDIAVSDELNAEASGGSSVNYKGNPKVNKNVSGGSAIEGK